MKRSELPSLDDFRAFETVARLGSVRAAAQELCLTHGAVSRRVSKLANDLGFALLAPQGRGIRLTAAGAQLAEAATAAFEMISARLSELRVPAQTQPIVLSCERSLAMRWLIPRLSSFQDRHPEIEVHLSTGGGNVNFASERIGLAIRRLDFALDPRWVVCDLMAERVGPVMAPSLVGRFEAGDFVGLASRTRSKAWAHWLEAHPGRPRPRAIQFLDHHFLMIEAAIGGLGVALAPDILVRDDVALGRLVAPCGFEPDGTRYGLICAHDPAPGSPVETLRAWLQREAATPAPIRPLPEGCPQDRTVV